MSRLSPSYRNGPIGIVDSGIGGLTVWQEIMRALPQESTVYIGDQAHLPYGRLGQEAIRDRVKQLIHFLMKKNVKLVVVACNTATVAGIDQYRTWFPHVPIIGVVPVIKTAASMTKTGHIAVLSTPNTATSEHQKLLIETFAGGHQVEAIGIPDLAQRIEEGVTDTVIIEFLEKYLKPETLKDVDVVVLGCTHYLFVRGIIQRIVGPNTAVIDSGAAVARQVARVLTAEGLLARTTEIPYRQFYTTGNASGVSRVAQSWMGGPCPFVYEQI
ncbi:glutamate racemase [Candidatus Gottesmanbacteria bacterium]|nr:glutamate racemase [Candidatus Gottesmanbacteria bacterium]